MVRVPDLALLTVFVHEQVNVIAVLDLSNPEQPAQETTEEEQPQPPGCHF